MPDNSPADAVLRQNNSRQVKRRMMMILFQWLFWLMVAWLSIELVWRSVIWHIGEQVNLNWFWNWAVTILAVPGLYSLAYSQPILHQEFWWLVLILLTLCKANRLSSRELAVQLSEFPPVYRRMIYTLMLASTMSIQLALVLNATNVTGIWN